MVILQTLALSVEDLLDRGLHPPPVEVLRPKVCPLCGHLTDGTICESYEAAAQVITAWTIFKLKVVKRVLSVIMRLHLWYEMRKRETK